MQCPKHGQKGCEMRAAIKGSGMPSKKHRPDLPFSQSNSVLMRQKIDYLKYILIILICYDENSLNYFDDLGKVFRKNDDNIINIEWLDRRRSIHNNITPSIHDQISRVTPGAKALLEAGLFCA